MKKFAFASAAAIAAVMVALVLAPSAIAYPDVRIDLSLNRQVLYGGQSFTVTATAQVTCHWTLTWNGVTRQNTSPTYVTTYLAPTVTRITKLPVDGTCHYAAGSSASTWHRAIMVTVLPRSSAAAGPKGTSGNLPNTGGPDEAVLFGGLALVFAGAGAVRVARRRAEDADLSGQTA